MKKAKYVMFLAILMTAGLVSCEGTPISSSTISLSPLPKESRILLLQTFLLAKEHRPCLLLLRTGTLPI